MPSKPERSLLSILDYLTKLQYHTRMKTCRLSRIRILIGCVTILGALSTSVHCRSQRHSALKAFAPTVTPIGVFYGYDAGASSTNCGAKHAVCGTWHCADGDWGHNCITSLTACGYYLTDGGADAGAGLCQYNDTELSNAILGSSAQSVPGGSFCPGIPFSVNTLTDSHNCGYCGAVCPASQQIYCLNGICGVP